MSQKKNRGGRPKGLPKTGGRQKGSRNKGNVRLREKFAEAGFDFVAEVMETVAQMKSSNPRVLMKASARSKLLVKLMPYFMQRLRQEEETPGVPEGGELPGETEISTADLVKLAKGKS